MIEKVKEIIAENLSCDLAQITPEAKLMEDLGADSLDVVELSMALEDEFGIEVKDEDFADLMTVSDIVTYIENRK